MTKKIRGISIIIVSLFLFSGWGMPSFLKKNKANKLYEKEAYPEALDIYQDLQIDYPYKADINYNEGNILYRLERYNEAENAFKKALQSKDKNIVKNAHYNIGNTLFRQDKLEEAIKSYEETLKIDSTDQDAEYNIELIKKILQKKQQQKQEQKPDKEKDKQNKKDKPQGKQKTSGGKNEDKEEQRKNEENQENKKDERKQGDDEKNKSESDNRKDKKDSGEKENLEQAKQILDAIKRDEKKLKKILSEKDKFYNKKEKVKYDW